MTSMMVCYTEDHGSSNVRRWAICFFITLALHAAPAAVISWGLHTVETVAAPPPAAIMVDMAPLTAPPPAPPTDVRTAPRQQHVATLKPPQQALWDKSLPIQNTTVPLSASQQREQPHPQDTTLVQETTAPPTTATPAVAAASSPSAANAPSNALPTWQGLVVGRLQQFKRYPSEARAHRQQGIAYLRFTMDREGRVLAFRIETTSGYALLDEEVLALIQRAQPLPKPPLEVAGDRLELVVPIEFFLRDRR